MQSKFLGAGVVVPHAIAGTGAVATQARANTKYGPEGLKLLGHGWDAQKVIDSLIAYDPGREERQVGIVDAQGNAAAFTGKSCMSYAGHKTGAGYTVQGNILKGEGVISGMALAFENTKGELADRILAALDAAERAGGDSRGRQSAALLVVRDGGGYDGLSDRYIDIRVDDNKEPLVELRRIYGLWKTTFLLDARLESIKKYNENKQYDIARAETQKVAETLAEMLKANPDDPETLNQVAWTLATAGIDKPRALDLAKRAVTLAPGKLHIMDTLAECHWVNGHTSEAVAIASELVAKEPANDHYWRQLQKFRGGQ